MQCNAMLAVAIPVGSIQGSIAMLAVAIPVGSILGQHCNACCINSSPFYPGTALQCSL